MKLLIPYGWLRAILFVVIYIVAVIAASTLVACLPFLWQLIHGASPTMTAVKETLGKMLWPVVVANTLGAVVSVWFARKFVDKASFFALGFTWKGFEIHAYTGFLGAIAMLGTGTFILLLTKNLSFTDVSFNMPALVKGAGMMALVAFSEELIFRGYLLNNLMQSMSKWLALAITALVFAAMHLGNPGMGFLSFLEIFVAGIMLGINYVYTKNLWFAILLHFAWNFIQGPVLGYEVSGVALTPILRQNIEGPTYLTGGSFGFEGSVLSTLVNLIFIGFLVFVYERNSGRQSEAEMIRTA